MKKRGKHSTFTAKHLPSSKENETSYENGQTATGPDEEIETELFLSAMKGVRPIENNLASFYPENKASASENVLKKAREEDRSIINELKELVQGKSKFDIKLTGEYVEGHVVPIDPKIIHKLKDGKYTMQAHIDLHGLTREEARIALSDFIHFSLRKGYRTVLVVHGRGLKSRQGPVLKKSVIEWLSTGRFSRIVLGFCSARPCDGGTGALYVLLRKKVKRAKWKTTV